ncbi:MAG: 30S ribosomal protein S6 [Holosporales bacterium]
MQLYETVFIARQDMSPAQVEALMERFASIIRDKGGEVSKTEYCGLRTMSYLIKKNRKGHYVLLNIKAPAEAVAEMERNMRISEDVLRFMSVRVLAHEKGPSALLKSSRYQREEGEYSGRRGHRHDAAERQEADEAPEAVAAEA